MGKTRDLFQKIRDTKGTFQGKMGTIKNRNGKDLTEAKEIKEMWQEYTEELYKKELHDLDNHDGVITHLEPDILECEVKQSLENITTNKASGGDGIPVGLFQILKDDAVKVLHSICQQIWKTQQWPQDWKRSVFIPFPRKAMPKNAQTTTQLHSSHNGTPLQYSCLENPKNGGGWQAADHGVTMAPHSSTLAWKIPWMEEPGGLQSMESLRVRHD